MGCIRTLHGDPPVQPGSHIQLHTRLQTDQSCRNTQLESQVCVGEGHQCWQLGTMAGWGSITSDCDIPKWKCCHFDEIFITGCAESCQNDNFRCRQWRKFHQNDISIDNFWLSQWENVIKITFMFQRSTYSLMSATSPGIICNFMFCFSSCYAYFSEKM